MKIIDNFLDNPYEVRNRALEFAKELNYSFPFTSSHIGSWPGFRICSTAVGKDKMIDIVGNSYIEKMKSSIDEDIFLDQISIQWVGSIWGTGAAHTDYPNNHISITYLTEDPPPNSGTEVYPDYEFIDFIDLESKLSNEKVELKKFDAEKQSYYFSHKNEKKKKYFLKKIARLNSHFKNPVIASNKFNRNVIYNSRHIHRAQDFFGDDLDNSRMTLVSFWDK